MASRPSSALSLTHVTVTRLGRMAFWISYSSCNNVSMHLVRQSQQVSRTTKSACISYNKVSMYLAQQSQQASRTKKSACISYNKVSMPSGSRTTKSGAFWIGYNKVSMPSGFRTTKSACFLDLLQQSQHAFWILCNSCNKTSMPSKSREVSMPFRLIQQLQQSQHAFWVS